MREWIYETDTLGSVICPAEVAMRLINSKWKIITLRDLLEKSASFGDLHRSVLGISRKILTENLRELEQNYMIIREVILGNVIRVQYKLSPFGESMKSIIRFAKFWNGIYQRSSERSRSISEKHDKKVALYMFFNK